jgi:hypothetical protein
MGLDEIMVGRAMSYGPGRLVALDGNIGRKLVGFYENQKKLVLLVY